MANRSGDGPRQALIGREDESAAVESVVAGARNGGSAVLVVRGEPGIGKTALLDHAVEAATDLRVLRIVGVEAERDLGFAALHGLIAPLLDALDSLPGPQRSALRVAFGLEEGAAPDRLFVGLGALTLLSTQASARPIVCVVDDVQWLDEESARALAFVARRLHADPVAMLFAVRDDTAAVTLLEGLDTLGMSALSDAAAGEVLRAASEHPVDNQVVDHVVAESNGNPLTLVEAATSLTADELAGVVVLRQPLPLGPGLQERFLGQVDELPADAQLFLLVAATEGSDDTALVRRAAARLGIGSDSITAAEQSRLLTLEPGVAFRHPLVRSAVYQRATTVDRRRVHEALAVVSDRPEDAHRRAWHRAAAAEGPDEAVAVALEDAATRARGRGGDIAAAAFLRRAADLTPDDADRAARILAAAEAELAAGAPARALRRVEDAMPDLAGALRARALRLNGTCCLALGRTDEALPTLIASTRALAAIDDALARDTLLDAVTVAVFTGRHDAASTFEQLATEAHAIGFPPPSDATPGDLLLEALVSLYSSGLADAAPRLRAALERLDAIDDEDLGRADVLRWLGFGCLAAGSLGDFDRVHEMSSRLVRAARERGALVALTRGLYFLALAEVVRGELDTAADAFAEGREIRAARGDPAGLGGVMVLGWRGADEAARAEAAEVILESIDRRQRGVAVYAEHGLGTLDLGRGDYHGALAHTRAVDAEDSFFLSLLALPDLIEAAVRSGEAESAAEGLERLEERAGVSGTPFALGMAARSRALLADRADAESAHVEAIELLGRSTARGHLARAHLLFGEHLRRQKRRRDARTQLRLALELFESMGAEGFADRARVELLATGEHARRRSVDTAAELTPQEQQVARLAAAGSTNSEIGSHLFISASTVDYHLRKVYRKLGIASRRDLAGALRTT